VDMADGSCNPCSSPTSAFAWSGLVCEQIAGLKRPFLVIRASGGFVACGYVNPAGAGACGDACATFSGVSTHDDILDAKAVAVTPQAVELGAVVGMLGRDFLELVRGNIAAVPSTPSTAPIGLPTEDIEPFEWTGLECTSLPGLKRPFLVIRSSRTGGFAACGYMSALGASKCGDIMALFKGVSTHHDILDAKVVELSDEAEKIGVKLGMSGREYLSLIK
jgi:uncharacterized protein YunC (DUF1805 family)